MVLSDSIDIVWPCIMLAFWFGGLLQYACVQVVCEGSVWGSEWNVAGSRSGVHCRPEQKLQPTQWLPHGGTVNYYWSSWCDACVLCNQEYPRHYRVYSECGLLGSNLLGSNRLFALFVVHSIVPWRTFVKKGSFGQFCRNPTAIVRRKTITDAFTLHSSILKSQLVR